MEAGEKKKKKNIYSLLPISRRCPATSRAVGLQYTWWLLVVTVNAHTSHPPPPFLLAFIAEQIFYGTEYPFGQFGSAVLPVSPPKILPTPSLLVRGGTLERQP